ncbi:MmgE/PrpD, partial [Penicillium herquei]
YTFNTSVMSQSATSTSLLNGTRTDHLAEWSANLRYQNIPQDVVQKTKDFFLDWLGCAIAGRHHPAVSAMAQFAKQMGPSNGKSELIDGSLNFTTSPAFASLVNGASSHVVEQDDLHNRSIMHPATVIYPAALAVAQEVNATGEEFIAACVVGYEVGCRVGEYLGKSHYERFHSTATGGVIGVAAATAHLLKLDAAKTLSAIGTAGTQAAGLWQFLLDATHSKQVHTGKACFDGIFAAYTARDGLLGPRDILEGPRAMGVALVPGSPKPEAIDQNLGSDWAIVSSSFKWHASCRHTHPSVDALLSLMKKNNVSFDDIDSVVARTYQAALNVLGLSGEGETVHQSKFSMGFVLAIAAKKGQAMITDFTEEDLKDKSLRDFQKRVSMVLDQEIDNKFPEKWQGTVIVTCKSGEQFTESVEFAKGDPELPLTKEEIERKTRALATYGGFTDVVRVNQLIERAWNLESETRLHGFSF